MTEYLIKRYILEQLYEQNEELLCSEIYITNLLYKLYCEGKIRLDKNKFLEWLKNMRNNKLLFGDYVLKNGLIDPEIINFELSESKQICCLKDSRIILSQVGEDCYSDPYINPISSLIINGIYDNEMIYIANVIKNNGVFIIGYCGCDNGYTKRVMEYYRNITKFLGTIIDKNQIAIKEEIVSSSKILILTNKR